MDAKIFIYFLLATVLMGGSYGVFYMDDLDSAQRELGNVQTQIKSTDELIETRKARLVTRQEAAALIATTDLLEKEQEGLRKEIAALEQQEAQSLAATLAGVKTVREKATGQTLPEIVLNSGKTLTQIRIQSVDESVLVATHSEGVAKIPAQDLPQELKDRFVFGIGGREPAPAAEAQPEKIADTKSATVSTSPRTTRSMAASVRPVGNIRIEGDPALWNEVTRRSLGRVFVPGKGWLVIGTRGPIPPMKDHP